jgi:crotonobetainyl-CoA:carnitine CoA-transferase CaiB-like acyl-CoA transferase
MTPLQNLKLLDLSRQLPGPFCSTMLADLGMETLMISNPTDPFGSGIPFMARNKRSMKLNLKTAAGREVLLRLVDQADVLLEGFRPGVMKRLGLDYATLAARNPRLIYCAISGYGQDGPYRDRVGHDVNYLGFAGVLGFIGHSDGAPVIPGVQIADIGAGALMAVIGILCAVIARQQTGRGQMVDISMLDGAALWNVYPVLLHLLGETPQRGRTQLTGYNACYAVYETKDHRYVTVGAYEGHFWATLCTSLGHPEFIERQWVQGDERQHILETFRAIFRTKTQAEWLAELGERDICFGPVNDVGQMLADPQLRHRGMVVDQPNGQPTLGNPVHLSETPPSLRTPPPLFGEHTETVLHELGFDAAGIERLRADGVIGE